MYLSRKTIENKTKKSGKRCPKCHKCFLRLDTHLRRSTSCRDVEGEEGLVTAVPSQSVERVELEQDLSSLQIQQSPELHVQVHD